MQIRIDDEFAALIPPLQLDEYERLEASIKDEGCRDALVVWEGENILVDGHNRYKICSEHGIEYRTVTRPFASRTEVAEWMLRNQLGRRNLTDAARIQAVRRFRSLLEAEAKERQVAAAHQTNAKTGKAHDDTLPVNLPEASMGDTRDRLGEMAGVSGKKYEQGEYVDDHAPAPVKQRWEQNELSTYRAHLLTKAFESTPNEYIDQIIGLCDDNDEKVRILNRLHKSAGSPETNGTFFEIMETGGFHYGGEMDKWCDYKVATVEEINRGLRSIAEYHAKLSMQEQEPLTTGQHAQKVLQSSESNEWYTPRQYLDAVHELMGGIDVDPASNPMANETVRAVVYYTIETDGFTKEWRGRVFLNPPYGKEDNESNQSRWSARLIEQYEAGITTEAVLLVNAATASSWFQRLWGYTICFTDHRIRFTSSEGDANQPTHGNVFVYFGGNVAEFVRVFSQFGVIAQRLDTTSVAVKKAA